MKLNKKTNPEAVEATENPTGKKEIVLTLEEMGMLTDEQLEAISGGGCYWRKGKFHCVDSSDTMA